jgi:uncharacterized protein (DUF1810 family)
MVPADDHDTYGEYDLERFVRSQDDGGVYEAAVAELRRGRKTSHWMWFVFPQIAGLGFSSTSRRYALPSLGAAAAYLRHPVLGARLLECAGIVARTRDRTAEQIFGGIDAQKLQSCMTLFARAAPSDTVFADVLDLYFDGLGDPGTDGILRSAAPPDP